MPMLTYSFVDIGSESLYQHLYKCIKNDVLTGVLSPGTKLPSKRSFAKNLGISTITVEGAYQQLLAEGYIYSLPKKGYYVSDISGLTSVSASAGKPQFHLNRDHWVYPADFMSNQIDPDNFPFSVWTKLMREVMADGKEALMKISPCGGVLQLREAIAGHLRQFRNMNVSADQIIVGAGTEYLYGLIIQLLGFDKVYAVEDPGYQKAAKIYRSNGVACRYVSMDGEGLCIDALEDAGADVAHVSPAHHYPTGIVTPIGRRYALLGWAAEKDSRYIIEDDYDSEFRLAGNPIPTMQSIDVTEKVIYINTFTKSLAPTIRVSYMVLPSHLAQRFYEKLSFYACTVSTFDQYTLARFIQDGHFEKHINRMRNYYRNLRDALLSEIRRSPMAELVTIREEDAGLHFLMEVDTLTSDQELLKLAEEKGVRLSCLSQYEQNREGKTREHVLVLNYSGIKQDHIGKAVKLLSDCVLSCERRARI